MFSRAVTFSLASAKISSISSSSTSRQFLGRFFSFLEKSFLNLRELASKPLSPLPLVEVMVQVRGLGRDLELQRAEDLLYDELQVTLGRGLAHLEAALETGDNVLL